MCGKEEMKSNKGTYKHSIAYTGTKIKAAACSGSLLFPLLTRVINYFKGFLSH